MSHGPLPAKGFAAALPVAKARGNVMFFRRMRGGTADLMVSDRSTLAIIRVRYAPRLAGSPAEIALEYRDVIAELRLHPSGGPVSRELWLYSRYCMLRFFRVEDTGIVELRADGSVMPVPMHTEQGRYPAGPASRGKPPLIPAQHLAAELPVVPAPGGVMLRVLKEPVAKEGPGGPRV